MKSCLIVDDSKVIRKVARHILETLEFDVEEAGDGQEALSRCEAKMPDVVLLDWNMACIWDASARPVPSLTKSLTTPRTFFSPSCPAFSSTSSTIRGSMSSAVSVPRVRSAAGMVKVP